jgi:hypothetical protein
MLVFGGIGADGDTTVQDVSGVWSLDLKSAAWESLTVAGPAPPRRDSHSAVYVPGADEVVLFGGGGDGGLLDDTWALSLGSAPQWVPLQATGGPPGPRARHSAIYDPVGNRMVVFGGASYFGQLQNDVWSLSLGANPSWTQLTPAGSPPSPRAGHRAVYDPVRRSMLVFGGYQGGDDPYAVDLWELTLDGSPEWRRIASAGPSPGGRFAPDLVFDGRKQRLVLCGGAERVAGLDVWSFGSTVRGADEPVAFSIGPNPIRSANHSLTFFVPVAGPLQIEIIDIAGRRLWTHDLGRVDAGWHSTQIGATLSPGLYWIRAAQNGQVSSARLTVVR